MDRYEEALEKARKIHRFSSDIAEIKRMEEIFPELKESEGEKIRKELLEMVKVRANRWDVERFVAWLEKQGKPADKVESKFKVGDWITNGKLIGRVEALTEFGYHCSFDYYKNDVKFKDSGWYLWTIQDAKDGDVLAISYETQNYILIYKGLYEKSFKTMMSVYCFYSVEEDTYYDGTDNFHVMNRGEVITPATKEQRDLLFQKMKDAGYEWDAEKKELKKIEQKPEWSKKDKEMLDSSITYLCNLRDYHESKKWNIEAVQKCINWLNSLRPQPKQECNEIIDKVKTEIALSKALNRTKRDEVFALLDSLRPQKQWKPSKRQLESLEIAARYYMSGKISKDFTGKDLTEILEQLKQL